MIDRKTVHWLLDKLCVDMGFCLRATEVERLANDPPEDAIAFTDEVFRSEGLDPQTVDRHQYRQVRAIVSDAFRETCNG
ncbi:MAG: hypothetical protein IPK82_08490 [Polyangiaceae bacterium]|nr:hypothetical protein [Polyangiaceae bacterium]